MRHKNGKLLCVYTAARGCVPNQQTVRLVSKTGKAIKSSYRPPVQGKTLNNIPGIYVTIVYLLQYYETISLEILNGFTSKSSSTTHTYKIVSKYWQA